MHKKFFYFEPAAFCEALFPLLLPFLLYIITSRRKMDVNFVLFYSTFTVFEDDVVFNKANMTLMGNLHQNMSKGSFGCCVTLNIVRSLNCDQLHTSVSLKPLGLS
jgi:hypothetical protein